jgi:hypothetical protein
MNPRHILLVAFLPVIVATGCQKLSKAGEEFRVKSDAITFTLDKSRNVSAAIYDPQGRLVRELLHAVPMNAGKHSLVWDGLDRDGRPAEPGLYSARLLQTPGFTSKFITALGINPGMKLDDPAYERTGRQWAGSHDGVTALAMDADGLYVGGGSAEFVPLLLKQSWDGTQRMWERQQFEPAQGAISMALAHGRLVFLQENGKAMLVDPATGRETGRWDLKHESVSRDPAKYFGSGDKVYNRNTIDIAGHGETLVVSHKGQNLLRWIDAAGKTIADLPVTAPGGVTVAADGRIWVISEGKVLEVAKEGVKRTVVQGLTAPLRLCLDAQRNELLVVEAAPVEQVKRYSLDGELRATYGRLGGRQDGPYVAADFRGVSSIVADGRGGFYVAENSDAPRRVAHFDAEGRVAHEWYGPCSFFTRPAVDPQDPRKVWYAPETGSMVLATIDYAAGTWAVTETYHVAGIAQGLFPPGLGSYTQGLGVRYHEGGRYLVFGTSPPNIALHENGKLLPVVAGDQGAPAVARAAALAGTDPPKAAGYLWTDRNRDGTPQADEIQFFDKPMPRAPKQQATVGPDFTFLNPATVGTPEGETLRMLRLAPRGWANGVPDYPTTWEEAASTTFPKGTGYESYGVLEHGNDRYALLASRRDYQGVAWPTLQNGSVRVFKFDRPGQPGWSVGRHASSLPGQPGEFHEPTGFVGALRGVVVACDRSVRPGMAWTEDGLYAGSFLDHREQDGLPDSFYCWWSTPNGKDAILNYDQETSGAVFELDGAVYWIANGWQCLPVYRVTGWDGWQRQEIPVRIAEKPASAVGEGTGLRGRYFANRDLSGTPAIERTDARVWFWCKDWYGTQTEVWTDGPKGLGRKTDFSASWVGEVEAPLTEEFTFSVTGKGRSRLWVDGRQIIHGWNDALGLRISKPLKLQAGKRYAIRLDFSTGAPQPECSLNWESFSVDRQRIPRRYLYPVGDGGATQGPQARPATESIDPSSFFVSNGASVPGPLHLEIRDGFPKGPILAGYQSIDFGTGVTRFVAKCNSWVKSVAADNKVEVRIDAADGPLLGAFHSPPGDGPADVVMPVATPITGVHDLYLILVPPRPGGAYWVNMKEFRFE